MNFEAVLYEVVMHSQCIQPQFGEVHKDPHTEGKLCTALDRVKITGFSHIKKRHKKYPFTFMLS